jgi:hypothetical protein
MGIGLFFNGSRDPPGGQYHRTVELAAGVQLENIDAALVVFLVSLELLLGVELLAALVYLHLIGKGIRDVERYLFPRLFEGNRKLPGLAGKAGHHGLRFDGDVGVGLHGLDFFIHHRRNQRFVWTLHRQLAAPVQCRAAQLGSFLYDGHRIAGIGRIQGRGHAGDAATDHQNLVGEIFQLVGLRQIDLLHPGHTHPQVVFGHHLNAVEVILVLFFLRGKSGEFGPGMAPGHAFAQVDPIDDTAFEPENVKIYAARTRAQDQRIDATLDLLFQKIDTRFGTEDRVRFGRQPFFIGYVP